MRRVGHALLSPGDDEVGAACRDLLHRHDHRPQPRAADLIDAGGRRQIREAGAAGGLARRVHALARGQYLPKNGLADLLGINTGIAERRHDRDGPQFMGRE